MPILAKNQQAQTLFSRSSLTFFQLLRFTSGGRPSASFLLGSHAALALRARSPALNVGGTVSGRRALQRFEAGGALARQLFPLNLQYKIFY